MPDLFTPVSLGALALPNRILMAPMTRSRAGAGNVPTDLTARYYVQRATAGLIITEATQVAPEGQGYLDTPGIHSDAQVAGWRRVTDAVHAAGGRIALQLWHVGRISHPAFQPGGALPVAPSAVAARGYAYTAAGQAPFPTPRALALDEIPGVVRQFGVGARLAKAAGFDAVEIHAANGYLVDQFLRDGSNRRTDGYGGGRAHRARFLLEVTEAVADAFGADRVGVRLSPQNPFNDMQDSDPGATFEYAAAALNGFGLAFLHVTEEGAEPGQAVTPRLRAAFRGPLVVNGGYTFERATNAIRSGRADAVAFAKAFLANPDLPARFRLGASLNEPDPATFYGGTEKGYTDYPALAAV